MANSKRPEVPRAETALNKMKNEIATELGYSDYDQIDKGELPARVHGKIGGTMIKRMIEAYENQLAGK